MKGITVVGLGQGMAGDDGVGPMVVEALRGMVPPAVTLRASTDATTLVEALAESALVVLVDAVLGDEPGRVQRLSEARLRGVRALSSHVLSVPEAVGLARALHPRAGRLEVVAIDVAPPAPGAAMTPPVQAAIPLAAALVRALLAEAGDA